MIDLQLEQTMRNLFSSMNAMDNESFKTIDVLRAWNMEHRTLQQSLVRVVIIPILKRLAQAHKDKAFDARNEASCALAAKMLAAVTEDDLYLPFV